MRPIQQILCVLDPQTTAQPSLSRAALLGRAYGARVELLMSVARPRSNAHVDALAVAMDQYQHDIRSELEKFLAREAKALQELGIETSTTFGWHTALTESILSHADRIDADLIIKDTHYHTAIQRALYTDTDRRLLRSSVVPLWLVRGHTSVGQGSQVVACVDPMRGRDDTVPPAWRVLGAATQLAQQIDSTVDALYVHQPLSDIAAVAEWAAGPTALAVDRLLDSAMQTCRDQLDVACRDYVVASDRRHVLPGRVAEVLPAALTDLGAGVAVLSRSAPSSINQVLLGSTVERILDHAPCDLLLLPA